MRLTILMLAIAVVLHVGVSVLRFWFRTSVPGAQTLLAAGIDTNNVDQWIDGFGDSSADGGPDPYYARVTGSGGEYSLLVTVDADFDSEPNDGPPPDTQEMTAGAAASDENPVLVVTAYSLQTA